MSLASRMMTARRKPGRWHWTDIAAYAYLAFGVVLMFGPVLWLGLSSFKTQAGLLEFPPSLLPMSQKEVVEDLRQLNARQKLLADGVA